MTQLKTPRKKLENFPFTSCAAWCPRIRHDALAAHDLEAENAKLRKALRGIAKKRPLVASQVADFRDAAQANGQLVIDMASAAAAALGDDR